jgi:membrane protein DedA with SNARE-associated domain
VPLFAGISRFRPRKFIIPVTVSILCQHSLLVWLGYTVGSRWEQIKSMLQEVNIGLGIVAAAVIVAIFFWFRSVRRGRSERIARRNVNNANTGEETNETESDGV